MDDAMLPWPPTPMRKLFTWWTSHADLVLVENPLWYQVVCSYSPLVYAPFYIVAAYAFVFEKNFIRVPCLVWAGMMLGALPPVFIQELTGYTATHPNHASQTLAGKAAFLVGYGGFLVVPVLMIVRMLREPFPIKHD